MVVFAAEELFTDLDAPIRRVGGADCFPSYNGAEQEATLPSVASVVDAARGLAGW